MANRPTVAQISDAMEQSIAKALIKGSIPKFRGKGDSELIDAHLENMERMFLAEGVTSDIQKARLIARSLDGEAARFHDELDPAIKADPDSLKRYLQGEYMPKNFKESRRDMLHNRVQGPMESISAYARDIKKLVEQGFPDLNRATKNDFMKDAFIRGLLLHLKQITLAASLNTFTNAVDRAEAYEMSYLSAYGKINQAGNGNSSNSENLEPQVSSSEIVKKLDALDDKL